MAELGAKINVFRDPFMDRASEADDLMAKIRGFNSDEDGSASATGASSGWSPERSSGAGKSPGGSAGATGSGGRTGDVGRNLGARGRKDHLDDLLRISDDLKTKADRVNALRLKKDGLEASRMKRQGLDELRGGLKKACDEYDKMADDLEKQVTDMDDISQRVNQTMEDRKGALAQQIG